MGEHLTITLSDEQHKIYVRYITTLENMDAHVQYHRKFLRQIRRKLTAFGE